MLSEGMGSVPLGEQGGETVGKQASCEPRVIGAGFRIVTAGAWALTGGMPSTVPLARRAVSQPTYEPGRPIEDVARDFGLDPDGVLKLASNENAWGASPRAVEAVRAALGHLESYPDGGAVRFREAVAAFRGVDPAQVVPGNGSNEILELLGHAYLEPGDEVVMGAPAFIVYRLVSLLFEAVPVEVPLVDWRHDVEAMLRAVTPRTRMVCLATPNNPTGASNRAAEVRELVRRLPPHVLAVIDEAYAEFDPDAADLRAEVMEGRPVVLLRTFSKAYGLAGLRVGYAIAPAPIAAALQRVRQPFNVNTLAQVAAIAALGDTGFVAESVARVGAERERLAVELERLGCPVVPSRANFLLVKTGRGREVFGVLQRRGVVVRPMDGYGLPDHVRITVGRPEQNDRLLAELAGVVRA